MRSAVVLATVGLAIPLTVGPGTAGSTPGPLMVWVLEPPDQLVQYDALTFERTHTIDVPSASFQDHGRLIVNGRGQVLVRLDAQTVWTWDGKTARTWDSGAVTPDQDRHGSPVTDIAPQWFLGADGVHLFAAADVFTVTRDESGVERSRSGRFELWRTDLSGGSKTIVVTEPLPGCACETGVCSETCPESELWAPDGVIDGFFFLTRWVPGQLGPTFESTLLYRERDARWQGTRLPEPVAAFRDARAGGSTWIETVPDAGCCGWSNESDDQTVLVRDGRRVVLFDELRRFGNQDYDVSFFSTSARLSPDGRQAALEIRADAVSGSSLRLAENGRENAAALRMIRQSLLDLPEVDIVLFNTPDAPDRRLPHAELVGWLNDSEFLIVEKGVLVAVDAGSGTRRESGIGARRAEGVRITPAAR